MVTLSPEFMADLIEQLRYVERSCPCGARSESLRTHPHVSGCPIGVLLGSQATVGVSEASGTAQSEALKTHPHSATNESKG